MVRRRRRGAGDFGEIVGPKDMGFEYTHPVITVRASLLLLLAVSGCQTVDPGPNFVVTNETFSEDFFFCHVEPEFLFAKKCGSGDSALGDKGCHFSASSVSGMRLIDHAPIDCGGGERPLSRDLLGSGSPAQSNLQTVSFEMSRDVRTAPLVVRPQGFNHPRAVLQAKDPAFEIVRRWAEAP